MNGDLPIKSPWEAKASGRAEAQVARSPLLFLQRAESGPSIRLS